MSLTSYPGYFCIPAMPICYPNRYPSICSVDFLFSC